MAFILINKLKMRIGIQNFYCKDSFTKGVRVAVEKRMMENQKNAYGSATEASVVVSIVRLKPAPIKLLRSMATADDADEYYDDQYYYTETPVPSACTLIMHLHPSPSTPHSPEEAFCSSLTVIPFFG